MSRQSIWQIVRIAAALLLLLSVLGVGPRAVYGQGAQAYALVDAVNAYRESLGLPRLSVSSALMTAAQRHVEWMAATYTYSHTGAGGSSPQSRAAAAGFSGAVRENVGGSTNVTPGEVVFFWDQSYGHQVTLRLPAATHIGAGYAANTQQQLFVLLVGTATGQAPQPTTQPIAGGTPAIDFTPPPGMVWSANGEMHTQSDYVPVAPSLDQSSAPVTDNEAAPVEATAAPAAAAYVMPIDLIELAEPRPDGSIVHVVQAGQTAWAIATRYGVDLAEILAINNLPESPLLFPGDEIIIRPGESQTLPPTAAAPTTHQVQQGESLWTIAAVHNLAIEDLLAWNDLPDDAVIQPGDTLVITAPTATTTATPSPQLTLTLPPTQTDTPPTAALPALMPPATEMAQVPTPALIEVTAAPAAQPVGPVNATALLAALAGTALLLLIAGAVVATLWPGRRN